MRRRGLTAHRVGRPRRPGVDAAPAGSTVPWHVRRRCSADRRRATSAALELRARVGLFLSAAAVGGALLGAPALDASGWDGLALWATVALATCLAACLVILVPWPLSWRSHSTRRRCSKTGPTRLRRSPSIVRVPPPAARATRRSLTRMSRASRSRPVMEWHGCVPGRRRGLDHPGMERGVPRLGRGVGREPAAPDAPAELVTARANRGAHRRRRHVHDDAPAVVARPGPRRAAPCPLGTSQK